MIKVSTAVTVANLPLIDFSNGLQVGMVGVVVGHYGTLNTVQFPHGRIILADEHLRAFQPLEGHSRLSDYEVDRDSLGDHYIIIIRHDTYWLVGPFETYAECAEWGKQKGFGPFAGYPDEDDPRWQTVRLPYGTAPMRIINPTGGPDSAVTPYFRPGEEPSHGVPSRQAEKPKSTSVQQLLHDIECCERDTAALFKDIHTALVSQRYDLQSSEATLQLGLARAELEAAFMRLKRAAGQGETPWIIR